MRAFEEPTEAERTREAPAAVDAGPSPSELGLPLRHIDPGSVLGWQRGVGNAAVAGLVAPAPVQRDDSPVPDAGGPAAGTPDAGAGGIPAPAQALVGTEFPVALNPPDPLSVPDTGAMGDYPTPADSGQSGEPPTAMALRDDVLPQPVQRDDPPHLSGDLGAGGGTGPVPFTLDVALVYRNLNLWQSGGGAWELLHEPQIQLMGDTTLTLSVQESVTLVNAHWMPPWRQEIEIGLSAFAQQQLLPSLGPSYGGQLQVEQHLTPAFSVTGTLTGSYAPPQGSNRTGVMSFSGAGLGLLVHFDGFGGGK